MTMPAPYPLFSAYGIELEYMIVGAEQLNVLPLADQALEQHAATAAAATAADPEPLLDWSNELVLHVIEVKNPRPQPLALLPAAFQQAVQGMNHALRQSAAQLMPTAMHPWMQPAIETRLWPHEAAGIYRSYDRIFNCRRHGWANLQSMHINLPFASEAEFVRLHAALRLLLPLLPALAASSPLADGAASGFADTRMEVYRHNASAIPILAGAVIPQPVASIDEYRRHILQPMYDAIAPFDPEQLLQHEWLNSHGAIARFERNAIEVRVVDMQECPQADIAIASATIALAKQLYFDFDRDAEPGHAAFATAPLARILHACVRDAEQAVIDDQAYLALLQVPAQRCSAQEVWQHLIGSFTEQDLTRAERAALQTILRRGPLARRILQALDGDYRRPHLHEIYRELGGCLQAGRQFLP
jgi:glutamate---cysteine ligase / carboxylate-amine ligase